MTPAPVGFARHLRLLVGATVVAVVTVVGVPAAVAGYRGTYAPTETITPQLLSTPTSFGCTAPNNNSVLLAWTDADGTTADPYGAFVIANYVIERKVNSGTWSVLATPARTAINYSDTNFSLIGLGDVLSYRIHSVRSTNWVSLTTSNTVTASVSSLLIFTHVSCP